MGDQIESIKTLLAQEDLVLLIQYGSSLEKQGPDVDIDLLAVCDNGKYTNQIEMGKIDLIQINVEALEHYLNYLDPVYCTEPFLTGGPIAGDKDLFDYVNWRISEATAMREVEPESDGSWVTTPLHYNIRQAFQLHLDAVNKTKEGEPVAAIRQTAFGVSYILFCTWYAEHPKRTPTLELLLEHCKEDFVRNLFRKHGEVKRGDQVSAAELRCWLENLETLLVRDRDLFPPSVSDSDFREETRPERAANESGFSQDQEIRDFVG